MVKNKFLLVVAGPTAVGKTSVAINLAQHFSTEIISADARQFYKELNIGTAKPSSEELIVAKHHFIDNLSINEHYTVGVYEKEVLNLLEQLYRKSDMVILAGGSGLFVKTIMEGMDEIPDIEPEIRESVNKEFKDKGLGNLLDELELKDPDYYHTVDKANPMRVIRAIEVCRGTGIPFSSFRNDFKKERFFQCIKIGLTRDREELYTRIDLRIEKMLNAGLVDEVKGLLPYRDKNALQTVGYKEVFGYLDGLYPYEEMVRLLKRNSRRYAKRQLTWFGKDKGFNWFHPEEEQKIIQFVSEMIRNG